MNFILVLVIATTLCYIGTARAGEAEEGPIVTLDKYGDIMGKYVQTMGNMGLPQKDYMVFRRIPYAKPIGKENRFRPPEPFEKFPDGTETPYDASKTGPVCPQGRNNPRIVEGIMNMTMTEAIEYSLEQANVTLPPGFDVSFVVDLVSAILGIDFGDNKIGDVLLEMLDVDLSISEDCLHLSVSTPKLGTEGTGFPVLFFIHGGGFSSGTQMHTEAERFGDVADVVVVTINYRVGPLGFMCLDTPEAAGNMGLLDMLMALEWVQEHIEKFGGDKDRVTIFGESAGSAAIGHLILSPLTKDRKLFAGGIGQSGSALSSWAFDDQLAGYHARTLAGMLNCTSEDDDELVQCLRQLEAWEINAAFDRYEEDRNAKFDLGFGGSIPCGQTQGDLKFYAKGQTPKNLLYNGDYNHNIPLFFGANSHEGSYLYGEVYNYFLKPNNYTIPSNESEEFMKYDFLDALFEAVEFDRGYMVKDLIVNTYFSPEIMGDLRKMAPGLVDMLGAFLLKASSYRMIEKHGGVGFWYSLNHKSIKSMFHLLNMGEEPAHIPDPGVSHGDELMYMFDYQFPLVLCNLNELMIDGLMPALTKCIFEMGADRDKIIECVSDPTGHFMTKYEHCLDGSLTEEEMVVSNHIVTAWTNFAATGHPTKGTQLPQLDEWNKYDEKYLIFETEPSVADHYTQSYVTKPSGK